MFRREQITSFSEIRLKVSGMRLTEVYEILCCGDDAEVSQYWLSYKNHEDNYNLQKRVTVPAADVIDVLNECGVLKWTVSAERIPAAYLTARCSASRQLSTAAAG